jgi:glycosyltransferase involved in cell wall biosynthesis
MSLAEVSVIIPCHRCTGTIARAVASVDAQTLKPAELILVDDCSGDDTLETLGIIQQAYGEKWIKIISPEENRGCGGARNVGWSIATQPYVAFLDADDVWVLHKVEIQFSWMRNHPDVLYTGHQVTVLAGNNKKPADITGQPEFERVYAWRLLFSNQMSAISIMAKRDMPYRYASDGRPRTEDYLLSCQICLDGIPIYRCTEKLAAVYKPIYGAGGLSQNLWSMEKSELSVYNDLYKEKRLGLLSLLVLQAWSLLKHMRRIMIVHIFRYKRKR